MRREKEKDGTTYLTGGNATESVVGSTVVRRTSGGQVKGATAAAADDLTTKAQMDAADALKADAAATTTALAGKASTASVTAVASDVTVIESTLDVEPGLTALSAFTGITNTTGCGYRRIGQFVEMYFPNFDIDSISVPVSGNVGNRQLFNTIPASYRPQTVVGIMGGLASGRAWTGYIDTFGAAYIATIQPDVTATGTATLTAQTFSGYALYPAGDAG